MLEKVRAHIAEYAETEKKMQDPAIYADQKQITKLSRRLKQLKPLVDTYAEYEKCERAVADAAAMKDDPELGPMAEEEAVKAREQMPVLMEKMKRLLVPKNPDDEKSVIACA
jgi:peptide chain release factor 1